MYIEALLLLLTIIIVHYSDEYGGSSYSDLGVSGLQLYTQPFCRFVRTVINGR